MRPQQHLQAPLPTPLFATFMRNDTAQSVSISESTRRRARIVRALQERKKALRPVREFRL